MIENIPPVVDSAFLYFHTRRSSGDEIAPFVDEIRAGLPNTYIWAGDGPIEGRSDDPILGGAVSYAASPQRYWFVFPMQSSTVEAFTAATEAMGAVLVTSGGYANAFGRPGHRPFSHIHPRASSSAVTSTAPASPWRPS